MERVNARQTMREAQANQYRQWGGRVSRTWPNEAADRLASDDPLFLHHVPGFILTPNSSIYTIGSCFARHVERELDRRGFDVPTMRFALPPGTFASQERGFGNGVLNTFTIHSIANEFDRVLGGLTAPNRGFIPMGDDLWHDPQATHAGALDWTSVNGLRDIIESVTSLLREADAVFITLGLTEGWLDLETGVHLNGSLPMRLAKRFPGRFQFMNPGYEELSAELRRAIDLLRKRGKPGVKVVLTVSPVPLAATFTQQDVIVANNHSKSILRAVAQEISSMPDVDYFPSYEMVMFSPRSIAWEADRRHVSPRMVSAVTDRFLSLYVGGRLDEPTEAAAAPAAG